MIRSFYKNVPSEKIDPDLVNRKVNKNLEGHSKIFNNLTISHNYNTGFSKVIFLMINQKSTRVLALLEEEDYLLKVDIFDIRTN